jgi:hypothetical protein
MRRCSFLSTYLPGKAGPSGLREGPQLRYLSTKPHVQPAGKAPKEYQWPEPAEGVQVAEGHPRVGVVVGAPNPYKGPPNNKLYSGDLPGAWTMHVAVFHSSHHLTGTSQRKPLEEFDVIDCHKNWLLITGPVLDVERYQTNTEVLTFTVLSDISPETWTGRGVRVKQLCKPGESVCKQEHLWQVGRYDPPAGPRGR